MASKQASRQRWLEKNPQNFQGPESAVGQRAGGANLSQDLMDMHVVESPRGSGLAVSLVIPYNVRYSHFTENYHGKGPSR